ncbi:MAG: hypothetical protein COA78_11970 [Blastopirellula sp.]|nr:MAG: hypothetical protein COA78_11970 [Blastopirellula sp.]
MHWILILTILTEQGTSIAQVGPFVTENKCHLAANKWLKTTEKQLKMKLAPLKLSAICVQK